jgi:hypothetical protein
MGDQHLPPSAGRTIFSCGVDHTDDDKASISPIIISRRWPEIGVMSKLNLIRRLHRLMIEETKNNQSAERFIFVGNVPNQRRLVSSAFGGKSGRLDAFSACLLWNQTV